MTEEAAKAPQYVIGIDLGTSNCAVAFAELSGGSIQAMSIGQLVGPGELEERRTLPSAIYLPSEHELKPEAIVVPFATEDRGDVVGTFARRLGATTPGRLVVSAKSWLCHPTVDRTSAVLPPGAPAEVPRVSPVEASRRLLAHLRDAWDAQHPDAPLVEQTVVLAVPASFDAVARKLTVRAAEQAGFAMDNLALIEEPQAAFYDYWDAGGQAASEDQLVLVVDVGGGTTDLTLIKVEWGDDDAPELRRVAVGDHLLLGGDNMDMAVAHLAEQRLNVRGGRLDPGRWALLVESCRLAKEAMLSESQDAETWKLTVPGRSSRLFGGALSCEVTREEVRALLLDGFFPEVEANVQPRRAARTGLAQLGLPYEQDAGVTRHIAAFLAAHNAQPDAILFNGGAFQSPVLSKRVAQIASGWADRPVGVLDHVSLDQAVARGAARFGLVRAGQGVKIGGGSAHAWFVEVASDDDERRALCLIPRGHELGTAVRLERTFELVVGRPVQFLLHATPQDRDEVSGDLIMLEAGAMKALPPLTAELPHTGGQQTVPVRLKAKLTELGALEVTCEALDESAQWSLEFDLRDDGRRDRQAIGRAKGLDAKAREALVDEVALIFGNAPRPVSTSELKQTTKRLPKRMGIKRNEWTLPMLREMWEELETGLKKRRRSSDHEALFFNLAGWTLRPGFGFPSDEWRMRRLWSIWRASVNYHQDSKVWNEWWVMWRRVVGGLDAKQQRELLAAIEPWLNGTANPKGKVRVKGDEEMLKLLASLERIDPAHKVTWGEEVLGRIEADKDANTSGWCLARIGARVPFTGSVTTVVAPDRATDWADRLLKVNWKKIPMAAFAAAHIARRTDDRLRDIDGSVRAMVQNRLAQSGQDELAQMVGEVVQLDAKQEGKFLGDALPQGLKLID